MEILFNVYICLYFMFLFYINLTFIIFFIEWSSKKYKNENEIVLTGRKPHNFPN